MNALKSLLSDLKDAVLGAVANVLDREAVVVTGLAVSGVVAVAGSARDRYPGSHRNCDPRPHCGIGYRPLLRLLEAHAPQGRQDLI
jgi:hypothetical protein